MKTIALALSATVAGLTLGAAAGHAAADPIGVWMDDTGRGAIEIAQCPSGKGVCGHLVWVKDASDKRRGCGKQIIGDAKPVGGGRWDNGWIYSPDKKRNYDVELKPLENGNLRVTGYAGVRFLSKTMIWKPAPADLQRCSTIEAKAGPDAPKSDKTANPVVAAVPAPAPAGEAKAPIAEIAKPSDVSEPPANAPAPAVKDAPPAAEADVDETPQPKAEAPESEPNGDNGSRGGLKLGDLDLDQVLTRTKGGKCKLDLPWVKVKFDCGAE